MIDLFNYRRRNTSITHVGDTPMGGDNPIRVQSMTTTATTDTKGSVAQTKRIVDAGGEYVRLTTQGVREAENLRNINSMLRNSGYTVPLVADVHFNPNVADVAALYAEKVRVNPGNYIDPARTFKHIEYTDEEYAAELKRLEERFTTFLDICRKNNTAVRIGVNHGSLSDRIMSRYGDTPEGIVESCMEFLRICRKQNFNDVVISIKASNTVVMVRSVRLLVDQMEKEGLCYPLHLGVTEAGEGEDGRIKSAVGIGALLADGIGDTIRVSLSEEPEAEIPVARKLVDYITSRAGHKPIEGGISKGYDPVCPQRRVTTEVASVVGGRQKPIVIADVAPEALNGKMRPDFFFAANGCPDGCGNDRFIVPQALYKGCANESPLFTLAEIEALQACKAPLKWLVVSDDVAIEKLEPLRGDTATALIVEPTNVNVPAGEQALLHALTDAGITLPAVIKNTYSDTDDEWLQVKAGADFGTLLLNGFSDGIWLSAPGFADADRVVRYELGILQASRLRMSKTEFISCPGCGRTLYDLQTTVKRVKEATSHLSHLKIGIMGCIVNGPGEMADADYGYVGAAAGKISLYKNKECVERNIPEAEAIPRLIALIKANGDWIEPEA